MRKFLSFLLVVIIVLSTLIPSTALKSSDIMLDVKTETDYTVGDANKDGFIDMKDTLSIRKYCSGVGSVDEDGADLNCDGKVNAKDLLILKKCNAGIDSISNYEDDKNIDSFTIAGNDISEYSIVYEPDSKYVENAYYAADTFRKLIKYSTGEDIEITTEKTTEHVIKFMDVTEYDGLEAELETENYKYEVVDGDLLIYGTRRGALYAVYEIAEEYLGYRFYSDEFTYQYADRAVDIPEETEVFRAPYLDYRICTQGFWRGDTEHYFARRLNGSDHGNFSEALGTLTGPHFITFNSFAYYWKMATGEVDVEYNGSNGSEYLAKYEAGEKVNEMDWNPCFTDDFAYNTLFRGLLETMRFIQGWHTFRDDTSSMSFAMCDNYEICQCIECKYIMTSGLDRKRGERLNCGTVGLNLYIANKACRDLKAFYEGWEEIDGELYWTGRAAGADETGDAAEYDYYSYGYGEAITDAYPNMKLFTTIYDHAAPHELLLTDDRYKDIIPHDDLILMMCGTSCNNHYMGSNECCSWFNPNGRNGYEDSMALVAWGELIKKTGSEMWFTYYPVNNCTYLTDSPNIFNIWHDFKFLVEECNVTGIYCEGAEEGYLFENLKSHLAASFMWSVVENEDGSVSYMSYDEFISEMKEYLRLYYGDGYEYIYEYICMQQEASDINTYIDDDGVEQNVCYMNRVSYPGEMFDYHYICDNYEYMRELVLKAIALAEGNEIQRCEFILMSCEMLGLSAVHKSWYAENTNDPAKKEEYIKRYDWVRDYITNHKVDNPEDFMGEYMNSDSRYIKVSPGDGKGTYRVVEIANRFFSYEDTPFEWLYDGGTTQYHLDDEWILYVRWG